MNIVKATRFELDQLQHFIEEDKPFESYVEWRKGHAKDFDGDVEDIFSHINQKRPEFQNPEKKPLLHEFLQQKHKEFVDMRNRSKGNPVLSYLATKASCKLYDKILDNKLLKDAEEAMKKPEQERSKEESQAVNRAKNSMKLGVRKNIDEFKAEFDEAEEVLSALATASGTDSTCLNKELNPKDAMDFLKSMANNLMVKDIMKLVGKYQNLARHKLMTTHEGTQSIIGVKMGNEIASLLPEELGLLVDKDFESLKGLQLLQRQLFQYKTRARTPKTGGPIVVCLDESGSMGGPLIANAKAFLFGLWQIAKSEKRDLVVVAFGYHGQTRTKKIGNLEDMLEETKQFMVAGGTCFESPLKEAMRIIEDGGEFGKADIVFITDDFGDIKQKFLEDFNDFRERTNTKVVSLSLTRCAETVKRFSDQVVFGFDSLADVTF